MTANTLGLSDLIERLDAFEKQQSDPAIQHPYHPALHLADVLADQGIPVSHEVLNTLKREGLFRRGEYLAAYIGDANPEQSKKILRESIARLTENSDGSKADARAFARNLHHFYGTVFTGHPTFSMHPNLSGALARYFTALAKGADAAQEKADLERVADLPFKTPTLDEEEEQSLVAIRNRHNAIEEAEKIAIEIAKKTYPKDWKTIDYAPATVATWIPFDWGGRTDIKWNTLLEKRITLQMKMLADIKTRLEQIPKYLFSGPNKTIQGMIAKIDKTLGLLAPHHEFFKSYNQDDDPGLFKLAAASSKFVADTKARLTHPDPLIAKLNQLLKHDMHEAQLALVHLRSRLRNHGLSLAHPHFRINSATVLESLGKHIPMDRDTDPGLRDNAYYDNVAHLLLQAKSKRSNLHTVANQKNDLLAQQMMVIRQIVDHLDSHSPVRFLIEETQNAIVPLTVLLYAKMYGVEDDVDISPLFEEREGTEAAEEVVERLYKNESFRVYIQKRGRICIQIGYSDAGRYDGQLPAGAFAERVKGLILRQHAKYKLEDVDVSFFDTHGQSSGRGQHPGSAAHANAYINSPTILSYAAHMGIKLQPEESFQGGDGFLLHGTADASLCLLAVMFAHLSANHRASRNDPLYDPKKLQDAGLAFFEIARQYQGKLSKDPDYASFIEIFTGLLPATGSRPVTRDQKSGGARKLPRAIPHNGALTQIGILATVLYGLSKAMEMNPESFAALMKESPRFRMMMQMADQAMEIADPYVMISYVALYNPAFWQERARRQSDPQQKRLCFEVAQHLERLALYPALARTARRICEDFETFRAARLKLEIPGDPLNDAARQAKIAARKKNMNVLHAIRMREMINLFTEAAHIPHISQRHQISREKLIEGVLRLHPESVKTLEKILENGRNHGPIAADADFGKESDFEDERGTETSLPEKPSLTRDMNEHLGILGETALALTHYVPGGVG